MRARDPSGKSFFANADIENKELTAYEIAKKRVSGWVSSPLDYAANNWIVKAL
jgi:hypothetical protein